MLQKTITIEGVYSLGSTPKKLGLIDNLMKKKNRNILTLMDRMVGFNMG